MRRNVIDFLCILCGSREARHFLDASAWSRPEEGCYSYYRCCQCGLVALHPQPTDKEMAKLYEQYYTHQSSGSEEIVRCPPESVKEKLKAAIHEILYPQQGFSAIFIYRFLAWIILTLGRRKLESRSRWGLIGERGSAVDIGCGDGTYIRSLRVDWLLEKAFRFVGVDLDLRALAVALAGKVPVLAASGGALPFGDRTFDHTTMKHSLEHMGNPLAALREAIRILRPSGSIVVEVPNGGTVSLRLLGSVWSGVDAPRHRYLFTTSVMKRLLEEAGFRVLRVKRKRMALCLNITQANAQSLYHRGLQSYGYRLVRYILASAIMLFLRLGLSRDVIMIKGERKST